jgi:transcriptional regulator of acetoin/glycerol metabolism
MRDEMFEIQKRYFILAMEKSKFRPDLAAQMLGISRSQFFKKMKLLKIKYQRTIKYEARLIK